MSVSTEPITTTPPRHAARKNWSLEENAALQAAVRQHLAAHKFLDWDVIAAAIPGRTAHSSTEIHYYSLLKRLTHDLPPPSPTIPNRTLSRHRPCAGRAYAVARRSIPRIESATGSAIRASAASVKIRSPNPACKRKQRDACGPSARDRGSRSMTWLSCSASGSPSRHYAPHRYCLCTAVTNCRGGLSCIQLMRGRELS